MDSTGSIRIPWSGARLVPAAKSHYIVGIGFVVALGILLLALGNTPVSRTQEARVLETARQMMDREWSGWLVPILNGEPRLQKPPLAYWMTAFSFRSLGVSEWVGRLPTVLVGWLTLLATYLIARRAYDQRVALVATGTLLGSHLFFRHMRLAETDAPATLFVTIAISLLWRAAADPRARWFHLAAASTALAVLSKGAPAAFVPVFLIAFCWIEGRWDLLWRFFRCGAPLTLLVLATPWFAYVYFDQGNLSVVASELATSTTGRNHFNWPIQYLPMLLAIAVPWSGFVPLALYDSIRNWRIEPSTRFTLIWLGAVFVPLCFNGNKQIHYLLMLTPPLMILVGRFLVAWPTMLSRWSNPIFLLTLLMTGLGAVAVIVAALMVRGQAFPSDVLLAALLAVGAGMMILIHRRRGPQAGMVAMVMGVALLMPVIEGVWIPSLEGRSMRNVAQEIRQQLGDGPYIFYGSASNLTLCFELRSAIPFTLSAERLQCSEEGLVVITQTKLQRDPLVPPAPFVHQKRMRLGEAIFDVYQADAQLHASAFRRPVSQEPSW